jgi:hypothetical protein
MTHFKNISITYHKNRLDIKGFKLIMTLIYSHNIKSLQYLQANMGQTKFKRM